MKNKNMLLIGLALGCGLVAAFLTTKLAGGSKTEHVMVLVAAKNLDQGTKLDKVEEQFVRKPFPKESVPPEFIDDVAELKDKTLQRTIRQGSHCTRADVSGKGYLELPVDEKTGTYYNAMAIKVSPETFVGGLIQPGNRVDVLWVEPQQNGKKVSKMILQNVLVFGVDTNITRKEDDNGFNKNAQTVTLALKQSEGVKLNLAASTGEIRLMLRSPDNKTVNPNLTDASNADIEGNVEKKKIFVAKELIPAGTKIEDVDKYFTEVDFLASSVQANFIYKTDEIKGKTVANAIAKNLPPTQEAFTAAPATAAAANVAATQDNSQYHTLSIQNGGRPTIYAHYNGDRLQQVSGAPTLESKDGKKEPKGETKPPASEKNSEAKDSPTGKAG